MVDGAAAGKREHREGGAAVVGKGAKPGVELVGVAASDVGGAPTGAVIGLAESGWSRGR